VIIGIPKETMEGEKRVALTPEGAGKLIFNGHSLWIEKDAGAASGYSDKDYGTFSCSAKKALIHAEKPGCMFITNKTDIFESDLVVKVKNLITEEYQILRPELPVFSFQHFSGNPDLAQAFIDARATAIAFEEILLSNGKRPILIPMSQIAGEEAAKLGLGHRPTKGLKPKSLQKIKITLIGMGSVGKAALNYFLDLGVFGMQIICLDKEAKKEDVQRNITNSDIIIISAYPVPEMPIITRTMTDQMKSGSVIIDVCIDEGGGCEATREHGPTGPEESFLNNGVLYICPPNIPGVFAPEKATLALEESLLPFLLEIADKGLEKTMKDNPIIKNAVVIYKGKVLRKDLVKNV